MSIFSKENENMPSIFLNCMNDIFSPTNLNENYYEFISESKEEPQIKQSIKFISTKQDPSLYSENFLNKKTFQKDIDLNPESDDSNNGRWGKEEQKLFAEAVLIYRNDWKKIQNHISSRNITQVRSHAQKFLMKLKENQFLKKKGLEKNLSWTKTMNFLVKNLTQEELRDILFSIEQTGQKKNNQKKNYKNFKKIKKNRNLEINENNNDNNNDSGSNTNSICESNNNNNTLFCYDYDIYRNRNSIYKFNEEDGYNIRYRKEKQEEEEKEILQKIIECFNSSSDNINLNTSFEENSFDKDKNNIEFKFLKYSYIDDKKIFGIL